MSVTSKSLRMRALKGSAATLLATLVLSPAMNGLSAQDQDQDDSSIAIEELTITGSRIQNANIVSPSPVTTVSGVKFDDRGVVLVEDLLTTLPQTIVADGTGNFGSNGTSNVNLRGLGEDRTLVLVDGRRLPSGNTLNIAPDINFIPGQLVEGVDLTTGGGSAVYGADAVAGVVNFRLKRDFEGIQIDGQLGIFQTANDNDTFEQILDDFPDASPPGSQLDGFQWNTTVIVGANSDDGRGNVTAYFTYRNVNELVQADRVGSACQFGGGNPAFFCQGSSTTFPAVLTNLFTANQTPFAIQAFDPATGETNFPFDFGTPDGTFNFAQTQRFRQPSEQYTFGALMHYDITENIEAYLDLMFSSIDSQGQIGPSGTFFSTNTINCDNPLLTPEQFDLICTQNGFGPTDTADLFIGRRNVEGGPRQQNFENTTFRIVAGFRGDLNDNWSYDIYGQYGRVDDFQSSDNDLVQSNLELALDVVTDPTTGNPVCRSVLEGTNASCVPYNIFTPGGVTQEALDFIIAPGLRSGTVEQEILQGSFSGDLTDNGIVSPWADTGAQLVVGFEYRNDTLVREPDLLLQNAELTGNGGATPPVDENIDVYEFFGELAVPIIQGATLAEDLSFNAAYRFSDFSTTGSQDTYALGLTWAPTSDVRFRFQYQRATRSPNIFDLFLPQNTGLFDLSDPDGDGVFDPCAGATPEFTLAQCANMGVTAAQFGNIADNPAGQFNAIIGGNPDLDPEISDTFTVGAVFTPEFIPGLNLTIDYYNIEVDGFIGTVPPELAVRTCGLEGDPFFCSLVTRDLGGGLFADPETSNVVATDINTGSINTSGIDIQLDYGFALGDGFGDLNLNYIATYLIEYEVEPLPGLDTFECAGFFAGDCAAPRPEYNHVTTLTWSSESDVNVNLTWRLIGETEAFSGGAGLPEASLNRFDTTHYIDVSVNFPLLDNMRVRAGINNLFDAQFPVAANLPAGIGTGNTFPGLFDVGGRFGFLGVTVDF